MTRGEAKLRVRSNLDDAGITFFSATDLEDALQDAYYFTSCFANTIEKSVDISFTANNPYYTLSSIIPDLFAVTAVYLISRKEFLQYKSRAELRAARRDYENWPGTPEFFFIHGPHRIGIFPQPPNVVSQVQTSDKNLKIFYRAYDDSVTSDTFSYRVPAAAAELLEYYATADLLEQAQEWTAAGGWWDKFYDKLTRSKLLIRNRPLPALVNSFGGVRL
jgi:hypothetical protein